MKYNPLNFFKYWEKHGFRKTALQWKENYLSLDSPELLLKKEIINYIGLIGALLVATVILLGRGAWYISLIMIFSIGISYINLRGKLIQLKKLKDMMKQFEEGN